MSISFSGLASGLDTSSWVESLVALKRAKVTTLEEEKSEAVLTKETIESIKSFFSSFRAVLEKVTDTKLGIASMDLFAQNLANSSNIDVLTATATTDAKEATYNILVDKLATFTEVNSAYTTTYQRTTTADTSSKLTELGVNIGNEGRSISVTVDGIERGINLTKNDTIATFVQKLNDIGVEAFYNEETGIFSVNIDDDAINEMDDELEESQKLKLKESLHLTGVNEGFLSQNLQVTTQTYEAANGNTTLGELGFAGSGNVVIGANDTTYTIGVSSTTTLDEFVTALNDNDITANLDAMGVLTIEDAVIQDTGKGSALKDALGLSIDIYEKTQKTGDLTHTTTITSITTAGTDTKIADLGEGLTIDDVRHEITYVDNGETITIDSTLTITNSNNESSTYTITSNSTIGEMLAAMQNAGLAAQIDREGSLIISGGKIEGAPLAVLGLESTPFSAMASGNALTETIVVHKTVDMDTRLVDDLKVTEGYLKVTTPDDTVYYEKIYSGQTIDRLMQDLANLGIYSTLDDDGVLEITGGYFETLSDADVLDLIAHGNIVESEDRYKHGTNLLECLYGAPEIQLNQTNVAHTRAKSMALRTSVTTVNDADYDTTLGNMGLTDEGTTAVFDVRGDERTITVNQDTTIDDLITLLEEQGISASFNTDTHRFSVNNATLVDGDSNLGEVLDLTTSVAGKYKTSDALWTRETLTINATEDTLLSDYGISNEMSVSQRTVNLYDSDGNILNTMTVSESTTIGSLMDFINAEDGISAVLQNGVLTIHNGYIENAAIEESMGLEHSNKSSYVLGSIMTHTTIAEVTGATTLSNIFDTIGTTEAVSGGYNLSFNSTELDVSASTTLNELIEMIYDNGGTAYVDATGRLSINGGTLTGTVADALGIVSVVNTAAVSATGEDLYTTEVAKADLATKFSDLGINSTSVNICNILGETIATVNFTGSDTIGDLFDTLSANGIDSTISDGVIRMQSAQGNYITGALAESFGISSQTVTTTVNTTTSSTLAVTHTGTVTANSETTLGEIDGITANNQTFEIYREDGVCLATISGLTTESTIGDMFDAMRAYDIVGSINNGIIELYSPSGNYAEGTIMDNLGITKESGISKTFTIAQTITTSEPITFTSVEKAQLGDMISDYITLPNDKNIVVNDSENNPIGTIAVTNTTTFDELFQQLAEYGISGDIHDGVISLSSTSGKYITGDIVNTLGLDTTQTVITTTTGVVSTSTATITYTDSVKATEDKIISSYVTLPNDKTIVVNDKDNNALGTVTVTDTTTFGELFSGLSTYGIDASIHNGRLIFMSQDGEYATGDLIDTFDMTAGSITVTTTSGIANTSSKTITYDSTILANEDSVISSFITLPDDKNIVINDSSNNAIATVAVTSTTTFGELFSDLSQHGIDAEIHNGIINFQSLDGNYAIGDVIDELNMTAGSVTVTTTTGVENTSSSAVTYDETVVADENSVISSFITLPDDKNIVINDSSNNAIATVAVTSTTTFGELFSDLSQHGINASIHNGIINFQSVEGNYATGDVIDELNMTAGSVTVTTTTGVENTSSSAITYTHSVTATENSVMADYITLPDDKNIVINDSSNNAIATVAVTSTTTFGELFSDLSQHGINANIHNGIINFQSIEGNYAIGDVIDELNMTAGSVTVTTTTGVENTSSSAITYTHSVTATENSVMADYITLPDDKNIVINDSSNNAIATVAVTSTTTFGELFSDLSQHGINANIHNGIINFQSIEGNYATGDVIDELNMTAGSVTVTTTTGVENTSSSAITYTHAVTATENSVMADYITLPDDKNIVINDSSNNAIATVAVTSTTTFGELFGTLSQHGINASIHNGIINFQSIEGNYATGDVIDELNMTAGSVTVTTTTGIENTSSSAVTYESTVVADENSMISAFITLPNNKNIVINDSSNNAIATVAVTSTTTFGELFSDLSQHGIDAEIHNGIINFQSVEGSYATGDIIDELNMTAGSVTVTTTTGVENTSSSAITYTHSVTATENSVMADYITLPDDKNIVINDSSNNAIATVAVTSTTTFGELFGNLSQHGIDANIHNGIINFQSVEGCYATGDIIDELNMTPGTVTVTTTSGASVTSSSAITYESNVVADSDSVISSFITLPNNKNIVINDNSNNAIATVAVTSTTTFGQLFNELAANGIGAIMHDGIINFQSFEGNYATGDIIDLFNMTPESVTVTTTSGASVTSSAVVSYTQAVVASEASVISDYIELPSNRNMIVMDSENTIIGSVAVTSTMTFGELFGELSNYGIDGEIHNGVINFQATNGNYVAGDVIGAFGMTASSVVTNETVGKLVTSNKTFTFNQEVTAGLSTKLSEVIEMPLDTTIYIKNPADNSTITSFAVDSDTTFDELLYTLEQNGINGSLHNGILTLYSTNSAYASGEVLSALGISNNTVVTTTTVGQTVTGTTLTRTSTVAATGTTLLSDIAGETNYKFLNGIQRKDAAWAAENEYTTVTTYSELHDALAAGENVLLMNDIEMPFMSWSKISSYSGTIDGNGYSIKNFISVNGGLIALAGDLTVENLNIDSANVSYNYGNHVNIGIIADRAANIYLRNSSVTNSVILNPDTDVTEYNGLFVGYVSNGSINNATILIESCIADGNVASDNCAGGFVGGTAGVLQVNVQNSISRLNYGNGTIGGILGYVSGIAGTINVDNTYINQGSGGDIIGQRADTNVQLDLDYYVMSDYMGGPTIYSGDSSTNATITKSEGYPSYMSVYTSTGELVANVDPGSTVNDMFNALSDYGIVGSINNGVIRLNSTNGNYIDGALPAALGIGTNTTVTTVTVGATTTGDETTYTQYGYAGLSSQISDVITLNPTFVNDVEEIDFSMGLALNAGVQDDLSLKYGNFIKNPFTYTDDQVAAMTRVSEVNTFSSGSVYAIMTVSDLEHLRDIVNAGTSSGNGATFVLGADLDLSCIDNWDAIGTSSNAFNGTLNGNGHVISNMRINKSSTNNQGLIGYQTAGTVKNIGVTGRITANDNVGMIVGYKTGASCQNCWASGTINARSTVGGIVGGSQSGSIKSHYSNVRVNCSGSGNGGIVGRTTYNDTISDCISEGTVSGQSQIGGIIGKSEYVGYIISNCLVTGNVSASGGSNIGGICGLNATVRNCTMTGNITTGCTMTGGISGGNSTVTNCCMLGDITATGQQGVGGIIGSLENNTLSGCYTTGNISGGTYTGGLIGNATNVTITDCYATGNISSSADYVGGLVGQYTSNNTNAKSVTGCVATGTISSSSGSATSVGNFIGKVNAQYSSYFNAITVSNCAVADDSNIFGSTTHTATALLSNISDEYGSTNVSTAAELHSALAAGESVLLMNDIDLDGYSWTQIASYNGVINGNGYSIRNYSSNSGGLFATLSSGATIINLNIDNADVSGAAVIADEANSCTFKNTSVTNSQVGSPSVDAALFIAAVANNSTITIESCIAEGKVTGWDLASGFIVASGDCNITIKDSVSKLSSDSSAYRVGGLVGYLQSSTTLTVSGTYISDGDGIANYGTLVGWRDSASAVVNANYNVMGDSAYVHIYQDDGSGTSVTATATEGYASSLKIMDSTGTKVGEISEFSTFGALVSDLSGYGITGTMSDGILTLTSNNGRYVEGYIPQALGIEKITNTTTTGASCTGDTITLTTSNTFGDAGISDENFIICNSTGEIATINVTGTTNIGSFLSSLSTYGISASINGSNKVDISFTNNANYFGTNSGTNKVLHALGVNITSTRDVDSSYTNSPSDCFASSTQEVMTSSTTFAQLGLESGSVVINGTSGAIRTITVSGSSTVGNLLSTLTGYGVASSIDDGALTLNYSGNYYLADGVPTSEVLAAMGITGSYNTTNVSTTKANTTSDTLLTEQTATLNTSMTFASLGLNSGSISLHNGVTGADATVTITGSKTVGEFMVSLTPYGIIGNVDSNGVATLDFNGDYYLVDNPATEAVLGALGISTNNYTTTNITTTRANTTDGTQHTYTIENGLSEASMLSELGADAPASVVINGSNGTSAFSLTLNPSTTSVGDLFTQLHDQGINAWIGTDGKVRISPENHGAYLSDASEWLTTTFGITLGEGDSYVVQGSTIWTQGTSDSLVDDFGFSLTTSTTLGELGIQSVGLLNPVDTINTANLTALSSVSASSTLASGTYAITTTDELVQLATMTNNGYIGAGTTFVLGNDIDLSSINNWTAIGNDTNYFIATFDGNGHTISGLKINNGATNNQGLFGYASGATIKNVVLKDVDVTGGSRTAGLVGGAVNTTIDNCYVSGSVTGTSDRVGMISGAINNSTIRNSFTSGTVSSSSGTAATVVGSIVGRAFDGNILLDNCHSDATVTSSGAYVGGIIGQVKSNLVLTNSSYTGDITTTGRTGGLIGDLITTVDTVDKNVLISNCNTTGNLTRTDGNVFGGLFGSISGTSSNVTITSCQTTATVPNNTYSVIGRISNENVIFTNIEYNSNINGAINIASGATAAQLAGITNNTGLTVETPPIGTQSRREFINVNYQGNEYTVTVNSSTSIDDIISTLAGFGISGSVLDGQLTLRGSQDGYITSMSDTLKTALKLDIGAGDTYTENTRTIYNNTTSDRFDDTVTNTLTTGTTFAELGVAAQGLLNPVDTINTLGMTALSSVSASTTLASGTYAITTTDELVQLATMTNSGYIRNNTTFVLGNDIDLSSINNWTAIGTDSNKFRATFDGNGHTISGLTIDNGEADYQGLFGSASGATIKNVVLKDVDVTGGNRTAGLVAAASNTTTIDNCYVSGSVTGTSTNVGLIAGAINNATIRNAFTSGSVNSLNTGDSYVGGIVGRAYAGDILIDNCHSDATVTSAGRDVGGIIGESRSNLVMTNSSFSGSITSNGRTGGLIGDLETTVDTVDKNVLISNCNATGNLASTSGTAFGGLFGNIEGTSSNVTITSCQTTATVPNNTYSVIGRISNENAVFTNLEYNSNINGAINITNGATAAQLAGITDNTNLTVEPQQAGTQNRSEFLAVNYMGNDYMVTVNSSDTVDDLLTTLAGFGISGSVAGGQVTLTGTQNGYISAMTDGLKSTLKIDDGVGNTYTETTQTIFGNTTSDTLSDDFTFSLTTSSTLGDLGINSNYNINVVNNGVEYTVTVGSTTSIDDLISTLGGYGISGSVAGGQLSLQGTSEGYILSIDNALKTALKLGDTNYTTNTQTIFGNTTSDSMSDDFTFSLTTSTTLGELGIQSVGLINPVDTINTANLTALSSVSASSTLASGTYAITTTDELVQLATMTNNGKIGAGTTFVLGNDIDLSSINNWTAIGNNSRPFQATFDGNGHTISGLTIDDGYVNNGLFGITYMATIKNVILKDVNVTGASYTAGLASYASFTTIDNCYVSGSVTGTDDYVGMLAGKIHCSTIRNVFTSGTVDNSDSSGYYGSIGGICGSISDALCDNCHSNATITNIKTAVGGIAGVVDNNIVLTNSSFSGNITNQQGKCGGLVGSLDTSTRNNILISNCNTTGNMMANSYSLEFGGLFGAISGSSSNVTITSCKTTATVPNSGYTVVGGISNHNAVLTNIEYNSNINGEINPSYYATDAQLAGITDNTNLIVEPQQIGVQSREEFINVNYLGNDYTVTVNSSTSIDDLISTLAGFGISGSVTDSQLSLQGTNSGYITYMSAGLQNALKLGDTNYTTNTQTIFGNTTSDSMSDDFTFSLTTSSTLGDLGINSNYDINVVNNGVEYTVTVGSTTSIDDLISTLGGYGISGSVAGGQLSLQGTSEGYILSIDNDLKTALKLGDTNYTTSTQTIFGNTTSDSMSDDFTFSLTTSSTLGDLGINSNYDINVVNNGVEYTVTVGSTTSIDDLISTLGGYGISGSVAGGQLSLQGTSEGYILSIDNDLKTALKLGDTNYTTSTQTIFGNTTSDLQDKDITTTFNTSSTFADAGLASSGSITVNYEGEDYTIGVATTDSLDDLFTSLASFGINGSVNNGVITLTGTNNGYVTAISDNVKTALGLNAGDGVSWTSSTQTIFANTTSDELEHDEITSLNGSTVLSRIGLGENGTVNVNYGGTDYIVTVNPNQTVGDMVSALAAYGISGTIADGKLTLSGTEDGYITSISENLLNTLKLRAGSGNTYSTYTTTVYQNTTSDTQTHSVTTTLDSSTTFEELGVDSNALVTIVQQGTEHTITVTPNSTVNDLLTALAGYGISGTVSNGQVTIAGGTSSYIQSMDSSLLEALELSVGSGVSYTVQTGATWVNSDSDPLTMVKDNLLIDGSTVLNTINGWNNGNGSLVVHQTNGQFVTISVDGTNTVDEFFAQISQYGLVGTIGEDGKVTITGAGNVYLQSVGGGSNILSSLNLSNVITNVSTITSNRTSNSLTHTVTIAATGTTTLENLEDTEGNGISFTGNSVSLVLSTTSDAGNHHVTLNFSKTSTLYDVMSRLSEYGISATVDAMGRFDVSSSTLNDFDISGALGEFLLGDYEKQYDTDTTYNISTNLMQKTVVHMTDTTLLSDLNVTSGNFEITQEGVKYTVSIANTSTVGDFRNLLAQYGINTYIDDEGHLAAFGVGETWLDSVGGGSNIVTQFGLNKNNWTLGEITQTSDNLRDTEVVFHQTSASQRLSELTDSDGNNLGITSGNLFVYQNGTRSTLYVDRNDTLQTLSNKLSQYGITMGVSSEGKIYFDGNNDSYLVAAATNATNFLSAIGADEDWGVRYNSESKNLTYEETKDETITRSTKLSALKNSDGEDLGITEGSFYIYQDGVRSTETITEDMTVNDLMSVMASRGLVADIAEDGSIAVNGHNNSYMATSSLMGKNSNIFEALFNSQWDFTNVYTSNNLDIPTDVMAAITRDTKLANIAETPEGDPVEHYNEGIITVTKDGVQTNITLTSEDTVGTFLDELALFGFEGVINDRGQVILRASGDSLLSAGNSAEYSNILDILGIESNSWISTNNYNGDELNVIKYSTATIAATRDTALSDIKVDGENYVSTGEYNIYKDGVKYTALISSDETIGSLMDTLRTFGVETSLVDGKLQITGKGDTYITTSSSATSASNVAQLFITTESTNEYTGLQQTIKETTTNATEATKISELNEAERNVLAGSTITVTVNGTSNTMNINSNDSIEDVLNKFRALGLEATLADGRILVQSGYDTLQITSTNPSLVGNDGLFRFNEDLGMTEGLRGYSASSVLVEATKTITENASVSKYADMNTKLDLLNISNGTLTVYRNGQKAVVTIDDDETFSSLQSKISAKLSDVRLGFTDDGYLTAYSTNDSEVIVGATTDTSNFSAITGIASYDGTLAWNFDEYGKPKGDTIYAENASRSARELYCVNNTSKVMTSGIFRGGDVTDGSFIVGNATITINESTTIDDVISQINNSSESQATAYWDNIKGQFVIQSTKTGSSFVNIEAGNSNFTDVMGYTNSAWDESPEHTLLDTAMVTSTQKVGDNARFSINGTYYTSTSNTIKSDVSRIEGVEINLKGLSSGEKITLTVERDKETLANAVADVVDSYNELMSNLEEQLDKEGSLKKESTLKLIRDQLKRTVSASLSSIGISTDSASSGNINTNFNAVTKLKFNRDTFINEFQKDQNRVKSLIVGTQANSFNDGIFSQLERTIENALEGSGNYFTSTENSYNSKISRLNEKIKKANVSLERYKALLEKKFGAMDMLIAQMNQQYSSFLSS